MPCRSSARRAKSTRIVEDEDHRVGLLLETVNLRMPGPVKGRRIHHVGYRGIESSAVVASSTAPTPTTREDAYVLTRILWSYP